MNLFRKKMEPRCAYCEKGSNLENGMVACIHKGVVEDTFHCRRFRYDPLRRVPTRQVVLPSYGLEEFKL